MGLIRTVVHRVPVLALDEYTLFPYTVSVLQVFEPAFRNLVDDCEATDRLIVVAGLERGWRESAARVPPVSEIAGLGKIVNVHPAEDGSREVFVHGIARVRIARLHQERPYRIAQVERLDDEIPKGERWHLRATLRRLHNYLNGLIQAGGIGEEVSRVIAASDDPGVLSYRLAALVVHDPRLRQELLENRSAVARLDVLIRELSRMLMETPAVVTVGEAPALN